jgi:hypothetical protein
MSKRLAALSLSLMLGAAAITAIAANTATAQPQTTGNPVLLAQNTAAQPATRARGPACTPPTEAELASRRAERCENLSALAAGRLAYMEARLNLTAAQRAAFTRWRDIRLAAAKRMATTCAAAPARGPGRGMGRAAGQPANTQAAPPSPVERMAREETRLRQRLADLTAERPALEALYNSLTPEQRQKFRPETGGRHGGMGHGPRGPRMAMMMRDRMGPRGGMMRGGPGGPMDRMGPPPGDQPPPPPSQFPQ